MTKTVTKKTLPPSDDPETLLAYGFEDAFLGYGRQFNREIAVYSYTTCIGILMRRDGMTWDEAEEFMSYNVVGAWVGDHTPIFLVTKTEVEDGRL